MFGSEWPHNWSIGQLELRFTSILHAPQYKVRTTKIGLNVKASHPSLEWGHFGDKILRCGYVLRWYRISKTELVNALRIFPIPILSSWANLRKDQERKKDIVFLNHNRQRANLHKRNSSELPLTFRQFFEKIRGAINPFAFCPIEKKRFFV